MKVSQTAKGNIKIVLSEDQACYVLGLLMNNNPKYDAPMDDPWGPLDKFFDAKEGGLLSGVYDRAKMLTASR